ncbi:MAG: thioesterase family protein [Leucobacter sp.]|nr:thioesterase family protein [Leucobacter sp.]
MSAISSDRSYFIALGNGSYEPTQHAAGAWREDELHLAPVAGLIVHQLEQWRIAHAEPDMVFSRFTFEVLGQIAREQIDISVDVVRPGRTIELVEAVATIAGRVTIRGRAWLLKSSDTLAVEGNEFAAMPPIDECAETSWLKGWNGGFIDSINAVQPANNRPGRARAWVTSDVSLVAGEDTTVLADFAKLLDTANGIAVREDPTEWFYPNVDLSLHFFRTPTSGQVGLDGRVAFGANGIGLTSTVMHDADGPVGMIQQSLTVRSKG